MSSYSSPVTPVRPHRSLARLSMAASSTSTLVASPTDPLSTPPLPPPTPNTPSTASSPLPQTPATPQTPASPSAAHVNNRKSIVSIRRKPVPLTLEEGFDLHTTQASDTHSPIATSPRNPFLDGPASPLSPSFPTRREVAPETPRYILPVDPPPFHAVAPSPYLPSTTAPGVDTGVGGSTFTLHEDLPRYAEETQTEPKTLARGLWRWGFLCPLLWFIGLTIMWIPLRPTEEEPDAEKAQKLEEMIVILRQTELKYAKRCALAFAIFIALVVGIVCIAVAVTHATKHF